MSDPKDRFQRLRTWEAATPGPWASGSDYEALTVWTEAHGHRRGAGATIATCVSMEHGACPDARHIATWDPETAREVVWLLRGAVGAMSTLVNITEDDEDKEACHYWLRRLDALLDRIGDPDAK